MTSQETSSDDNSRCLIDQLDEDLIENNLETFLENSLNDEN